MWKCLPLLVIWPKDRKSGTSSRIGRRFTTDAQRCPASTHALPPHPSPANHTPSQAARISTFPTHRVGAVFALHFVLERRSRNEMRKKAEEEGTLIGPMWVKSPHLCLCRQPSPSVFLSPVSAKRQLHADLTQEHDLPCCHSIASTQCRFDHSTTLPMHESGGRLALSFAPTL